MNKQRNVLITITYNEMGIITDTKAEEVTQPETNCSEFPNNSDTISRQAVLDAVEKNACNTQRIMDAVNNLPSVQPEPQWILCDERMPDDLSEVNVTWVNHNPEPYYEFTKDKPFTATAVYYKSEWYWYSATCVDYLAEYGRCDWNKVSDVIEIIAWMPLPEAYKPNK
jgi:hypothetical protein